MSLKVGAKRSAARVSFLEFDFEDLEHKQPPGRWECGNRAAISKGCGKRRETWVWFSSVFHAPGISTVLPGFIYALRLCWKRANNLRLASRISVAAWVSDFIPAVRCN